MWKFHSPSFVFWCTFNSRRATSHDGDLSEK